MGRNVVIVDGRKLDVEQLVTSSEIAERLGIKLSVTVHNWAHRYPEFPRPVIAKPRLSLWYWPDVEAWARATGRLPRD